MTRKNEELIASVDTLLRAHEGSGTLRHEDLIRELRDALKRETESKQAA